MNKVMLIGNLGADPERHATESGAMTTARLATSEHWRDKDGAQQERTDWHRLVFFGRLAEIAAEYLKKGAKLGIEGRLQTRKWQIDDGDRYSTEIVVLEMDLCDRPATETKDVERGAQRRR